MCLEILFPATRHDFQRSELQSVAHILVARSPHIGNFSVVLSTAFAGSCLLLEEMLSTEWLLESFHPYIPKDESESLKRGLCDECEDTSTDDEILDVLCTYKRYSRVEKATFIKSVEEIAH